VTVHGFEERLAYSHSQSDADYWEEVYRQAFPDFHTMLDLRHDGWHQRAGRDRAVILSSGKSVFIDEKVRSETYGDILIEVWSQYPRTGTDPFPSVRGAVPGWAVKPLDCDWLAYAFETTQTCHMFPFLGIRAAWAKFGAMWSIRASNRESGFRWIVARNRSYNTVGIGVPLQALRWCINDAQTIRWGGGR
jgi:hypothetical protein